MKKKEFCSDCDYFNPEKFEQEGIPCKLVDNKIVKVEIGKCNKFIKSGRKPEDKINFRPKPKPEPLEAREPKGFDNI